MAFAEQMNRVEEQQAYDLLCWTLMLALRRRALLMPIPRMVVLVVHVRTPSDRFAAIMLTHFKAIIEKTASCGRRTPPSSAGAGPPCCRSHQRCRNVSSAVGREPGSIVRHSRVCCTGSFHCRREPTRCEREGGMAALMSKLSTETVHNKLVEDRDSQPYQCDTVPYTVAWCYTAISQAQRPVDLGIRAPHWHPPRSTPVHVRVSETEL